MFSRHRSSCVFSAVFGGLCVLALRPLPACGPEFPNAYLATPAETLAALPTLSFAAELDRLRPADTARQPAPAASRKELDDVREALSGASLSREEVDAALMAYRREAPPRALPREFHLYAAGATAWHAGRVGEALNSWRELLALPPGHRKYRTTWAAYMIGRALWDTDGEVACLSLQQVRESVRQGFADSEGLAATSLGWEARVHLRRGDFADALRLYFQQHAAGDDSAVASLQVTLRQLFQGAEDREVGIASLTATRLEEALREIAADRNLRGIVTAWFTSCGGSHAPWSQRATRQFRQWLRALPKTDALEPAEADRWAWAAYQNGMWSDAAALAKLAPADAPASEWVRAMLLLREGDLPGATEHLAGAARGFPEDPVLDKNSFPDGDHDYRFASTHEDLPKGALSGVRGVLALQRGQYVESLRLFLHAGHWQDAAYVAERVLTLEELASFVCAEVPPPAPGSPAVESLRRWGPPARATTANRDLRHLLARRLARAGQFDRAREFYPASFTPTFDRFVASVRRGYREDVAAPERARSLWEAAQIAKEYGMTLQGTELEPDFSIWHGYYPAPDISGARETADSDDYRYSWRDNHGRTGLAALLATSADEHRRAAGQRPPTKRFHYRFRAVQLAWLASTLLPDNDEQTAMILNTAGRWIAPRHPEDAELLYKTLTFRCPRTALGKAAAERRWFVPPGEVDLPDNRTGL